MLQRHRPRRPDRDRAGAARSPSTASRRTRSCGKRSKRLADGGGHRAALARDDLEANAGRRGSRRRQLGCGDRAPARERDARATAARPASCTRSPPPSAPTCRSSSPTGPSSAAATAPSSRRSTCRRTTGCCCSCRTAHVKASTAAVYEALRRARAAPTGARERFAALDAALEQRPPATRPGGAAPERPRLVAVRRRAAGARRLPGRRLRRRPSRLRPLPSPPHRRGCPSRARRRAAGPGSPCRSGTRERALATVCTMSEYPTDRAPPGALRPGSSRSGASTSSSGSS